MSPTLPRRIILAGNLRFLREALKRVIDKSPGLQVIREISDEKQIPHAFEQAQADWVVVSLPPGGDIPTMIENLVATRFPTLRILGISPDGSLVILKWLAFQERRLSELSLEELTGIMHSKPGANPDFWNTQKEAPGN